MRQELLNSKAKNLSLLKRLGYNVPNFVVISEQTLKKNATFNWFDYIKTMFNASYKKVPDMISVRSSGSVSTPGRMETILNVKFERESVLEAIEKVRKSCESKRVKEFLELSGVEDFTYSIIFQEMIEPKRDYECSGVLISTNPFDNNSRFYAELIFGKLGDNLMSGKETPKLLRDLSKKNPIAEVKLSLLVSNLKKVFDEDFELEFVITNSTIHILQIRKYKPNSKNLQAIEVIQGNVIGGGSSINQRGFTGKVTFDKNNPDSDKILVIDETDFEDVSNMLKFGGIITLKGGRLSHASIIANQFNLNCVVGVTLEKELKEGESIKISEKGLIFE